jgi:hypothetical protein
MRTTQEKVAIEVGFAAWNEAGKTHCNHSLAAALHRLAATQWRKAAKELRAHTDKTTGNHALDCVREHTKAAAEHETKAKETTTV